MKASDLIRTYFAAYESNDRATLETLLSDDFTFSSPLDDRIDLEAYFDRCWPNSAHQHTFRLERIFEEGPEAYVTYECTCTDGRTFRNTEFFVIRQGRIHSIEVYFGSESAEEAKEEQVRALLGRLEHACRNKDVPGMLATYSPDVLAYDVISPLRYSSYDKLGMRLLEWLSSFDGPIQYEVKDLSIHTAHDIAFCHCLNHVVGKKTDGKKTDQWWRSTIGCQQQNGHWRIIHEHTSIPFDPVTGAAPVDLVP